MASPHMKMIDINDCVTAYMDESEQGIDKQFKLTQLAYRAMDELGIDFFYRIKSVKLPVNGNMTVNLPEDYLNFTKVGILNSKGEVIPLMYNKKLTNYANLFSDRKDRTEDNSLFNWASPQNGVFYNFWDGTTFGNLYGVPSGAPFVGSFKIDDEAGLIVLNEIFDYDYLMLEYVCAPMDGQICYVPIQFKEAVIAYIAWKDIRYLPTSRKGNLGDKRDRRHEYFNERRLAIARYNPIRVDNLYEENLRNQRLTVKA